MSPTLSSKSYVCDPCPDYPRLITPKRYWNPERDLSEDPNAVTLIFALGTGFHKKQWEPTIEDLYDIQYLRGTDAPKIREVWRMNCPDHGEAAVLNEEILQWGYWDNFNWQEYTLCIHIFLTGLGAVMDIDLSRHSLVGIGHSMDTCALTLVGTLTPKVTLRSLTLVEPMLFPAAYSIPWLVDSGLKRRDIWPSAVYHAIKAFFP